MRRRFEEEQQFLADAGMVLASSLDYEETLAQVAHLAVPWLADWCIVSILEEGGGIHRLAIAHPDPGKEELGRTYLCRNSLDLEIAPGIARVLGTGEPELYMEVSDPVLQELARTGEDLQVLREEGVQSAMVVPMVARGRTMGTITLVTAGSGRRLDASDLRVAGELARRAAMAVDNARLYHIAEDARREAERRTREEVVIRKLARALAEEVGVGGVAQLVVAAAVDISGAIGAYIERVESMGGEVEVIGAVGAGVPPVGTHIPYPGSLTDAIIRVGRPHLLTEVGAIGDSIAPYLARSCKGCSGLVVPLLAEEAPLGALVLLASAGRAQFSEEDINRAATLGDLASVSFRRSLLLEAERQARGEAERRMREERALLEATEAVTKSFTVDSVIQQIVENALTAANADAALVERVDIERGEVEVAAVAGRRVLPYGLRMPYRGSLAEQVVERQEPVFIGDLSSASGTIISALAECCPDNSALALPLLDAGEVIGTLILLREPEKWDFRPDETERATTFANLAALAFRKVHLLDDSERKRVELERVMESRTRLMRGFSHDVKNPLGAADGFLQLLEEGILDHLTAKQEGAVGRARKALGTALRLIDDLLALARAEAEEVEIEWGAVDMRDAVRETAEEFRAQAEGKGLAYTVELPDELPVIRSDANRARQILGNLISNAVKYTERGNVWVRVGVRGGVSREIEEVGHIDSGRDGVRPGPGAPDGTDRWVVVEVSDTGHGISEDQQRLLFQDFSRLAATSGAAGAGLGLAMSRRVADALGGRITVESEVGRGSTFMLWLPGGSFATN